MGFRARPGERVALIGKNGCGKSTLLQIMAGCLRPDSGEIVYYGRRCDKSQVFRNFTGYVPQDNPFMEQLTVRDNLKLWNKGTREQLEQAIREFELTEILSSTVESLSGGMKRRLAIACALMNQPSVLLLDEPTTALDFAHKDKIYQMLKQHQENQGIVVLATHDEEEIHSANRVLLVQNQEIREVNKNEISKEMLIQIYSDNK